MLGPYQRTPSSMRVYRGGCWGNSARKCRVAFRFWSGPGLRNYYLGFRPSFRLVKR